MVRCDFCMREYPLVATIITKSQIVGEGRGSEAIIEDGVWGACADCAALIESGNWVTLAERGVMGTLTRYPKEAFDTAALRTKQLLILGAVLGPRVQLDGPAEPQKAGST